MFLKYTYSLVDMTKIKLPKIMYRFITIIQHASSIDNSNSHIEIHTYVCYNILELFKPQMFI